MFRKKIHYLLEKRVLRLLEEELDSITISPQQYLDYLNYVSGRGDLLKKLFKGKKVIIDGDLNLNNPNIQSIGPISYIRGKLNIKGSDIENLEGVEAEKGVVGADYIMLKSYVETGNEDNLKNLTQTSSVVDDFELSDDRWETEIILRMVDEKFFEMCSLSDDDVWMLNIIFNPYGGYEFFDRDRAYSDFKEGYVYQYFDEDNIKKLTDILNVIAPQLYVNDVEDLTEKSEEIYDILETFFDDELSYIEGDYAGEMESAISKAILEEAEKELSNVFGEYGLEEVIQFYEYNIKVGKLLELFSKYGKTLSVFELFETISNKEMTFPYFMELQYQVEYDSDFDMSSFNRSVDYQLNKMENKIQDGEINITEFTEIVNDIKNRYDFNIIYILPKDKNKPEKEQRRFSIQKVDFKTNLIEVKVWEDPQSSRTKFLNLTLEDFNLLLHQPELF